MYEILDSLVRMLAPVLAFTSEEIWQYLPHKASDDKESIQLNSWPVLNETYLDSELEEKWSQILNIRSDVSKALEIARADKTIGLSLNAKVIVYADEKSYEFIKGIENQLATIFITSGFELKKAEGVPADAQKGEYMDGIWMMVVPAEGEKCERCWMQSASVGKNEIHPTLCERCCSVL
jgi:isoleucyl-tRNA synthetase